MTTKPARLYLDMNTLQFVTKPTRMRAPARDVKPAGEARLDKNAMARAKRLAAAHGIDIEREEAGAYWVTVAHLRDTDNDPLEGNHFCSDGREVLEAVERYVEHLADNPPPPAAK